MPGFSLKKKKIIFFVLLPAAILMLGCSIFYVAMHEDKNNLFQTLFQGHQAIDFNEQIRPIFNAKCITCHGGVKQSGGFSLLFPEEALRPNESGLPAIVPGKPEESELIRRIKHDDPELRMPLEHAPLSEQEIQLMVQWIEEGAQWEEHWAFIKPEHQDAPNLSSPWIENGIDQFILQTLQENDLEPSAQADKAVLLRRVSLDLTGLPPTQEQLQDFLNDNSSEAYEKVVDRLLASPHYGERWSAMWMDLARYADSKGYEKDGYRNIWLYRDWLIKAFNQDKPYDEFIIEQLAGDLLPNPTDEQLIATAFHRNTLGNDEGGTEDEEFRVAAVIDRVNTTWGGLQGITMECVQCHSHTYDPIRHEDFYRSYAFFNNTADADLASDAPNLKIFTRKENQEKLESIKRWVLNHTPSKDEKIEVVDDLVELIRLSEPKIHAHSFDQIKKGTFRKSAGFIEIDNGGKARLKQVPLNNSNQMLVRYNAPRSTGTVEIRIGDPDGELLATWHINKSRQYEIIPISIKPVFGKHDLYFRFKDPGKRGVVCRIRWVLFNKALSGKGEQGYPEVKNKVFSLLNTQTVEEVPVMVELKGDYRRKTHVFERGNWMVHGEEVQPGVPEIMHPMPEGAPANRLGFAQWLTSEDNPLTARVMVNRLWAQLFGIGIVETQEDFGSQGALPSHPELLDWLAWQFMHEHHWRMKDQLKQMVMSAAYQQSSKITPDLNVVDPDNRLLARGPRVRLSAEQVRDQALAVSGRLSDKMYGKSVMPQQPEGLWQNVYSKLDWKTSRGEDQYRRALYTFWRRSNPYPSMVTFDNPSREICVARRFNTNTPLQALVTLNDPVYMETAQALAARMMEKDSIDAQLRTGYELALVRKIDEQELHELQLFYQETLAHYTKHPEAAKKLTGKKDIQLATLTMVANVIMNLDEFITKL